MRRLAAVSFALAGSVLFPGTVSHVSASDWTSATVVKPTMVHLAPARAVDVPRRAPHRVVHVIHHASRVTHLTSHVAHRVSYVTHANTRNFSHSGLTTLQKRIRSCESGPNGYATNGYAFDYDYTNQNSHSTASGGWQFLDSTWDNYRGYSRAMYAPPAVQDEYFLKTFAREGTTPWNASRSCWGA